MELIEAIKALVTLQIFCAKQVCDECPFGWKDNPFSMVTICRISETAPHNYSEVWTKAIEEMEHDEQ